MVTVKEGPVAAKSHGILILAILSMVWISSQVGTVHGIVPTTTTPFVVKITSPHRGQQVGIGHNVTLLGSSNYNASSKCQVSIIVDKKKPYQNTIPIGQGADNYSQWKYTLSPTYTALTAGPNRVTAKLTCNANPTFTKSYSINLTGINQPSSTTPQPSQQQIAIKSNGTTSPLSSASVLSNSTLAQSNSTLNRANTTSVLPVSANSSSLIDPSSTHASSTPSGGHSNTHHPSHHTHHSSSSSSSEHDHSSSSSSSEHDHSHTHTGSDSHNSNDGGHSGDSHHGSGAGHDFFHGAFSHF
jgi:hypothetical protein